MEDQIIRKTAELLLRRNELLLNNAEWARLTAEADGGKGVSYQTIRRIEQGYTPRGSTLRRLERALDFEEAKREAVTTARAIA